MTKRRLRSEQKSSIRTSRRYRGLAGPTQRISGPGELVQAIPYLLGFHPHASLVLVGLCRGELVVTARLDLADAVNSAVLADTIAAMHGGGTRELIAAVYSDSGPPFRAEDRLPWSEVAVGVDQHAAAVGCDVADIMLVVDGRMWSYLARECVPPGGVQVPLAPSAFAAAATVAGIVALPDRASLAAVLEPRPAVERDALRHELARIEDDTATAAARGYVATERRAVKRALFAAARASDEARWTPPPDEQLTRFAVALGDQAFRNAVWMAVDDGRLDGRRLWSDLARRLPEPHDAAPLLLFGWATWRSGDGALAGIAAERAVASDPGYAAADLLLAALAGGVDPRRFPKLRLSRPA